MKLSMIIITILLIANQLFSKELTWFCSNNVYGFMDNNNVIVIKPQYEETQNFYNGYCAVKFNGKWGFINENNILIISNIYDFATSISEDLASVMLSNRYGYIDKKGNVIIAFDFERAESFHAGTAPVVLINNKSWSLIDKKGNVITNIDSSGFEYFDRTYYRFGNNFDYTKSGLINTKGQLILKPTFYNIYPFSDNLSLFSIADQNHNYRWGYFDNNFKIKIKPIYKGASSFTNNSAIIVSNDNSYYYIDLNGRIIKSHYFNNNIKYSFDDRDIFYKKGDKLFVVALSGLKIRNNSSAESEVIGKVNYGDLIEIIDTPNKKYEYDNINGFWVLIKYNNIKGYIFDGYLSKYTSPINKGTNWVNIIKYISNQFGPIIDFRELYFDGSHGESSYFEMIWEFRNNIYIKFNGVYESGYYELYLPNIRLSEASNIGILLGGKLAENNDKYIYKAYRNKKGMVVLEFHENYYE